MGLGKDSQEEEDRKRRETLIRAQQLENLRLAQLAQQSQENIAQQANQSDLLLPSQSSSRESQIDASVNSNQVATMNRQPSFVPKTEIIKLTSKNYSAWKWQITNLLDSLDLIKYTTSSDIDNISREKEAKNIIASSLTEDQINEITHCKTTYELWSALTSIFENKTEFAKTHLYGEMHTYKITNLNDVPKGISDIRSMASRIKALGGTLDDDYIESAILKALPMPQFASFQTAWQFVTNRNIDMLQSGIMNELQIQKRNVVSTSAKVFAANKRINTRSNYKGNKPDGQNKTQDDRNKSNSRRNRYCTYCKKNGHNNEECYRLARKKEAQNDKPNPSQQQESSQPQIEANSSDEPKETPKKLLNYVAIAKSIRSANMQNAITKIPSIYRAVGHSYITTSKWLADTGASNHFSPNLNWFKSYVPFEEPMRIEGFSDQGCLTYGIGTIDIGCGIITNVHYTPDSNINLLSLGACAKYNKIFSHFTDQHIIMAKDGNEVKRGSINEDNTYDLFFDIQLPKQQIYAAKTMEKWHKILGHTSKDTISKMFKKGVVNGLEITNTELDVCENCSLGKLKRCSHPNKSRSNLKLAGAILHFGTVGPMRTESYGGARYFLLCKDNFSAYRQVAFISSKRDIPNHVKSIISKSQTETGNPVLQIITDNGSEFRNCNLETFLSERGISHRFSPPYTPQANGFIERDIQTITNKARCMLIAANLSKEIWAEAINTSVYVQNRIMNTGDEMTPYQLWFNRKPNLNNMHEFGEESIVYTESNHREKFDKRGESLIFVGYTDSFNTYRFLNPETSEIKISCNVSFLNKLYNKPVDDHLSNNFSNDDHEFLEFSRVDSFNHSADHSESNDIKTTSIDESIQMCVNDDDQMAELIITSDDSIDVSPERVNVEENTQIASVDRAGPSLRPRTQRPFYGVTNSTRKLLNIQRRKPKANMAIINYATPTNYKEAIASRDSEHWLAAMKAEIDSLSENDVFEVVQRPNKHVVSSKWIFTIKTNHENIITRFKARFVARGFSQKFGLDYFDTYAPVASMCSVRLLISFAVLNKFAIKQFDIKTAFLYGILKEEIFVEPPEGLHNNDDYVWRLKKSLYGLKQSPREWNFRFTEFLESIHFDQSQEDSCIFYNKDDSTYIIIYVDDGLIISFDDSIATDILNKLKSEFKVHDCELSTFIGMQIEQLPCGDLFVHQSLYIEKMLSRFHMADCNPSQNPVAATHGRNIVKDLESCNYPYREAVGSLMYAAVTTRPDIAYAVGLASRHLENPDANDIIAVKQIFRYLRGTADYGLMFTSNHSATLIGYCDADLGGDPDTRRSTSGILFMYNRTPIYWRSKRQTIITTSSTESEVVCLSETIKILTVLRRLCKELGLITSSATKIFCDSQSAIKIAISETNQSRTKHLAIKAAFAREKLDNKELIIEHIRTDSQLADILTKATTSAQFKNISKQLVGPSDQ